MIIGIESVEMKMAHRGRALAKEAEIDGGFIINLINARQLLDYWPGAAELFSQERAEKRKKLPSARPG